MNRSESVFVYVLDSQWIDTKSLEFYTVKYLQLFWNTKAHNYYNLDIRNYAEKMKLLLKICIIYNILKND